MSRTHILEPTGRTKEAIEHINKYAYRKEFGLTSEEYDNEPLEELFINQFIMSTNSEIQDEEAKELDRKANI